MKKFISILLLLVVAAPAYSQTFLSEEEMLAKMVGSTVSGISAKDGKTPWTQVYFADKKGKPKGKIDGIFGGDPYKSKYYVKKGRWCENWGSGRGCWNMELVDDNTIRIYDKKGKLINTWTVQESN